MSYSRLVFPSGQRRHVRWLRMVRALWRDSLALWREFRRPFLIFIIVVFGGGFLYGELSVLAGYPRVPYVKLPYMMIQLMILQTSSEPPPELYLIVFYYALPLIAAYIVGSGAADFVRLFFNRSERWNAWEAAVASTYRNHIIILGVGHVGLRVVRSLVDMGFEVVAIDHKMKPELDSEMASLHVPLIVGDGRLREVLEKAGLPTAQAFIACTASDQVNLEAIMRARELHNDIRIVARMWDNQFTNQLKHTMRVTVLSASDLAAPAFAGSAVGIEITQTLRIGGNDYSMIRLEVQSGSFLANQTIGKLQDDNDTDIVLHERDGAIQVQPDNQLLVRAGDKLVLFARHDRVITIVERNQRGADGKRHDI